VAPIKDAVIETLNQLIEICKDAENGFRAAAEGVKSADLKTLFKSYSAQRALFANELQAEVQRRGGTPEEGGSLTATLHRGWMNIKSLVTGQDEAAITAGCERAEDVAVNTYEEALGTDLPDGVRAVLRRQLNQIKEAHDRIRALEEVYGRAGP